MNSILPALTEYIRKARWKLEEHKRMEDTGDELAFQRFLQMCEQMHLQDGARPKTTKNLPPYIMVAAIDFGTTFSGYAFSMKDEVDKIKMNKNWGAEVGCSFYKTPTSVLVKPNKEFCSFGFDAQQEYADLMEKEDQDYYYFERFKMTLHCKKDLKKSTKIRALNGKEMSAIVIFAMAIKYLKDHLVDAVNKSLNGELDEKMIRWVLTVPAIWSDASKQFMREAALKGGLIDDINSDRLLIALEPEVASLYVRKMDIGNECIASGIECGSKYLVIDAGGGTLDVTCHELQSDDTVKELHFATGGAHGGSKVDEQFLRLLNEIFDKKFLRSYRKANAAQWLKMIIDFERRKKACVKKNPGSINISMPYSFITGYQEFTKQDFQKVVQNFQSPGVSFNNGMLRINGDVVASLFKPVTDDIVKHLEDLLHDPKLQGVEYLFCVGGFNDSKYLQEVLHEAFGGRYKLVIPEEASLAVVKGAVMYGQNPNIVSIRVSALTYGTEAGREFIPFMDDPSKVALVNGRPMCFETFEKFVYKGQEVPVGFSRTVSFHPLTAKQDRGIVKIFSSDDTDQVYVTDDGVQHLGDVSIKWPGHGLQRKLEVTMKFGGTEIEVEAVTYPHKTKAETKISFLSK